MAEKQKLELTWFEKNNELRIEPRILIESQNLSFGNDIFPSHDPSFMQHLGDSNMLIHGDNLLALRALESNYTAMVDCIFIDPPYNTGAAFEHYNDNLEHSIWLNLMRARLNILHKLLSSKGTIWIVLDDNEVHYCKVLCDEIFGRNNFIADVTWNSRKSVSNDAIISINTNHILVFAKDVDIIRSLAKKNIIFRTKIDTSKFDNPDLDPRGPWTADPFDAPNIRTNLSYTIINPNTGESFVPPAGRHWRTTQDEYKRLLADNRIVFGKSGKTKPQQKRFLSEVDINSQVLTTLWSDLDTTTNATKHSQMLFGDSPFSNPKPEDLVARVIMMATVEGDLVLDSFLGSGTTAAAAHKLRRRWIGIELGNHAYSHCKVRIDKVISGQDKGGITDQVNWKGGGSYKFYELSSSLVNIDEYDQPIINPDFNADMLAAAIAKHEGYSYTPDQTCYWKQAMNGVNSFLFVTTRHISIEFVQSIANDLLEGEFLLIVCKSFDESINRNIKNVRVKKIPQSLLTNCEFGVNNYNLHIVNPPIYEEDEDE